MSWLSRAIAILAGALTIVTYAAAQEQHPAGEHHHPEAAKIQNPVPPDAKSVANGQKLYMKYCSDCHGDTGKGDGMEGDDLNPKPANLTDDQWKHGSTDGEIYTVIKSGAKGTGMKAFGSKLEAKEIWDVVNYIRSIGPQAPKKY